MKAALVPGLRVSYRLGFDVDFVIEYSFLCIPWRPSLGILAKVVSSGGKCDEKTYDPDFSPLGLAEA